MRIQSRFMTIFGIAVIAGASYFAGTLAVAQKPNEPLLLRQAEVMQRKPDTDAPNVRVWTLRRTDISRTNLVEMRGDLPRHLHPDADHSLFVLSGEVKVKAGELETILQPGDYISIPPNVPHKYTTVGERALLVSMDAPPYDPKRTVQLEPVGGNQQ